MRDDDIFEDCGCCGLEKVQGHPCTYCDKPERGCPVCGGFEKCEEFCDELKELLASEEELQKVFHQKQSIETETMIFTVGLN